MTGASSQLIHEIVAASHCHNPACRQRIMPNDPTTGTGGLFSRPRMSLIRRFGSAQAGQAGEVEPQQACCQV